MSKLLVILVSAAIFYAVYDSIFILNETQQAIITQFGAPQGESIKDAGLHFKAPFIWDVHYFEKRIIKWDGDPNEIPTNDKTFIWVDTTARWRIKDPLLFLKSAGNIEKATVNLINPRIDGSVRDLVSNNDLIEIIRSTDWKPEYSVSTEKGKENLEPVKIGRDKFSQMVLERVSSTSEVGGQGLDGFGIELLDVLVKRINYTDTVREKVYERMISERKRIAAEKRSEGEGQKAEILGKMERELNEITSSAYKMSETLRGEADGEATKISGEAYGADPEFYAFYKTLESYKNVLKNNTRMVIDSKSPFYKYVNQLATGSEAPAK